jgi:pyruvate/2-oxoglutarate/acetoin dehydrogenase E1 component
LPSDLFKKAVNEAMLMLAADPRTIFVGQSVRYDGTAMYATLDGVPMDRRVEMPVIEDFQLGYCTGLALMGKIPICLFPRMDFLMLAMNQLVNHLDKLPLFGWHPKVIIRTVVGSKTPLDAGPQHTQDHSAALRMLVGRHIGVLSCQTPEQVTWSYHYAMEGTDSFLIVENPTGDNHGSTR